jgi:hypothetical protein
MKKPIECASRFTGKHALFAIAALVAFALSSARGHAQDHDKINEANNPLTPKITINFQDYYDPSLFGLPGRDANQFLFRGLIPWKLGESGQLFRFTVPLATAPTFPSGSDTGIGDITLMNLTPFPGPNHITFAAGPILVLPTGNRTLGNGAFQLGGAGVVIAPQPWGILGALATYQHSLDDTYTGVPVSLLTFQPVVNVNLPNNFYLRSSAIWTFDLSKDASFIPIGLGLGRVFVLPGGTTVNAFIEPQYTVWHDGVGTPRWQIFAGINLQFALAR